MELATQTSRMSGGPEVVAGVTIQFPGDSSQWLPNPGAQPTAPRRWRVLTRPIPGVTLAVVLAASPQTLALPGILQPPDSPSPDSFAALTSQNPFLSLTPRTGTDMSAPRAGRSACREISFSPPTGPRRGGFITTELRLRLAESFCPRSQDLGGARIQTQALATQSLHSYLPRIPGPISPWSLSPPSSSQ